MKILKINITDKIPTAAENYIIVCGNNDYKIEFTFDEEWNAHQIKTAQFNYLSDGKLNSIPVIFEGNECAVPLLKNTSFVEVGVYAGDLQTTSILTIACRRSILCKTGTPPAPDNDVYTAILEKVSKTLAIAESVEERANNGEFNGKDGTPGKNGIPGADYVLTVADKQDIAGIVADQEIAEIEKAIDAIIDLQNSYIGGGSE